MSADKCGTYAGYNAHNRRGEEVCADCRRAATEYTAERRARDSAIGAEEKRRDKARARAWSRLAAMHPTQYQALFEEELAQIPVERPRREECAAGHRYDATNTRYIKGRGRVCRTCEGDRRRAAKRRARDAA